MNVEHTYPQSCFNTQSQALVRFLDTERAKSYVYQHQIEAVKSVSKQLQTPDVPNIALVVLPTGCGKTGVAVLAAYALNATRVLVVTPSVRISKQIHEAFCGSTKRSCFLLERKIIPEAKKDFICPLGNCIVSSGQIKESMRHSFMVVNAHKIGALSSVRIEDIPCDSYDLVIVDEAHHYPAPTWKHLIDHFPNSRRLFITATPEYKGEPILQHDPCYEMSRSDAVARGIIRQIKFHEVTREPVLDTTSPPLRYQLRAVACKVHDFLDQHDKEDPSIKHQALIMTQNVKTEPSSAYHFKEAHDDVCSDTCEVYVSDTEQGVLRRFDNEEIRTLVIVGKLLEGYDNKRISVVAIVRNVARQSKVLFSQFVGRAVRKAHSCDPVTAMIVSHEIYAQNWNFQQFDKVTEEDNVDEE